MNKCDSEVSPHGRALATRHRSLDAEIEGGISEDLPGAKKKRLWLRDKMAVHAPQLLSS